MKIEVLFFARLREALGGGREPIDLEDGGTVRDVVEVLESRPEWSRVRGLPLTFAVNEEIVGPDHLLRDGDRVALLTPFSGG